MKNKFRLLAGLLIVCLCTSVSFAEENGYKVMLKYYNLDQGKDYKSNVKMELINKNGKKRVRETINWKLEKGDYDKSLIYFLKPSADKGTAFLGWQQKNKDDDQWLYLPVLKRIRRVSSSEKDRAFMGSDFSYNDLTEPHPDEFKHKIVGSENIDGKDCYKVISTHKTYTNDAAYKNKSKYQYSKITSWIWKNEYVLIKRRMHDKERNEDKEFIASNIEKVSGIWTVKRSEMVNLESGHRTILTIIKIKYNTGLQDSSFRKRKLKKAIKAL